MGRCLVREKSQSRFTSAIIVVCILLFAVGCSEPTIYISGDENAIGTEVYVDGEKIGLMNEYIYAGSDSKNEIIVNRERELLEKAQLKKGQKSSGITIKLPRGKYNVQFVTKDGKILETEIIVKGGEMYGIVNFEKMQITID